MVLALSIWTDSSSHMLWLDGTWPADADPEKPGVVRGPCPADSGNPDDVDPTATVKYSNFR